MNLAELQRKLLAAARLYPPGEQVPIAFAERVMMHLQTQPVPDSRVLWARALWRAAICCVAIMLLLGALTFIDSRGNTSPNDLSQEFEKTMLVSVNQGTASLSPW